VDDPAIVPQAPMRLETQILGAASERPIHRHRASDRFAPSSGIIPPPNNQLKHKHHLQLHLSDRPRFNNPSDKLRY
jgi:hypothetical protein